jgi:hypothetical protein
MRSHRKTGTNFLRNELFFYCWTYKKHTSYCIRVPKLPNITYVLKFNILENNYQVLEICRTKRNIYIYIYIYRIYIHKEKTVSHNLQNIFQIYFKLMQEFLKTSSYILEINATKSH